MLCSTLRIYSLLFLMPLYPLASAVARLGEGGRGLGELVFGKGNFLPVGPQGALIAVTPSLPDTGSWRGSAWCACCDYPTASAGPSFLHIFLGLHRLS